MLRLLFEFSLRNSPILSRFVNCYTRFIIRIGRPLIFLRHGFSIINTKWRQTPEDLSDTCYNINYVFAINAVINSKRDSVGRVRSVRCSRMWIAKRYTFWTEHLHCNYSRGHCKHIDTEHSVNIVHAVGIMQHAKLHNGIILCPALANHSGKRSYFLLHVFFRVWQCARMANLIKRYRFFVVLCKSKFYYALRRHYTANYFTFYYTCNDYMIILYSTFCIF